VHGLRRAGTRVIALRERPRLVVLLVLASIGLAVFGVERLQAREAKQVREARIEELRDQLEHGQFMCGLGVSHIRREIEQLENE
jgi:hypothetical protein